MDDVEPKHAKPGDTIEITFTETNWFGRHFLVIPEPEKSDTLISPGDAWVINDKGIPRIVSCLYYRIVKRSGKAIPQETKSVDVSLERQRDDNLRSIFC